MHRTRKHPLPWSVRELASAYVVEDADGVRLGYFYWSESFTGTGGDKLSREEALRLARWFAASPGLVGGRGAG